MLGGKKHEAGVPDGLLTVCHAIVPVATDAKEKLTNDGAF